MRPTDVPDSGIFIPYMGVVALKYYRAFHPLPPYYSFIGLLCDLLWSDPDKDVNGWSDNERGVSFVFSPDIVSNFLKKHDLDLICRAH